MMKRLPIILVWFLLVLYAGTASADKWVVGNKKEQAEFTKTYNEKRAEGGEAYAQWRKQVNEKGTLEEVHMLNNLDNKKTAGGRQKTEEELAAEQAALEEAIKKKGFMGDPSDPGPTSWANYDIETDANGNVTGFKEKNFEDKDTDGDGKISKEEREAWNKKKAEEDRKNGGAPGNVPPKADWDKNMDGEPDADFMLDCWQCVQPKDHKHECDGRVGVCEPNPCGEDKECKGWQESKSDGCLVDCFHCYDKRKDPCEKYGFTSDPNCGNMCPKDKSVCEAVLINADGTVATSTAVRGSLKCYRCKDITIGCAQSDYMNQDQCLKICHTPDECVATFAAPNGEKCYECREMIDERNCYQIDKLTYIGCSSFCEQDGGVCVDVGKAPNGEICWECVPKKALDGCEGYGLQTMAMCSTECHGVGDCVPSLKAPNGEVCYECVKDEKPGCAESKLQTIRMCESYCLQEGGRCVKSGNAPNGETCYDCENYILDKDCASQDEFSEADCKATCKDKGDCVKAGRAPNGEQCFYCQVTDTRDPCEQVESLPGDCPGRCETGEICEPVTTDNNVKCHICTEFDCEDAGLEEKCDESEICNPVSIESGLQCCKCEPKPTVMDPCADVRCPAETDCKTFTCVQGECVAQNKSGSCDDKDACTSGDQCTSGACIGQPVQLSPSTLCVAYSCDPATGIKKDIKAGTQCDDGDVCTGQDQCDRNGVCKGRTITGCGENRDCAQNVPGSTASPNCGGQCPSERCEQIPVYGDPSKPKGIAYYCYKCKEGGCVSDAECDDGEFCNGAETCTGGECMPGDPPCHGQQCDESTDTCGDCSSDADCDDGEFCNGMEFCTSEHVCQAGTEPCRADETCDESSDQCIKERVRTGSDPDDGDIGVVPGGGSAASLFCEQGQMLWEDCQACHAKGGRCRLAPLPAIAVGYRPPCYTCESLDTCAKYGQVSACQMCPPNHTCIPGRPLLDPETGDIFFCKMCVPGQVSYETTYVIIIIETPRGRYILDDEKKGTMDLGDFKASQVMQMAKASSAKDAVSRIGSMLPTGGMNLPGIISGGMSMGDLSGLLKQGMEKGRTYGDNCFGGDENIKQENIPDVPPPSNPQKTAADAGPDKSEFGQNPAKEIPADGPMVACGEKDGQKALAVMDAHGRPVDYIFKDMLQKDPNAIMNAIQKAQSLSDQIHAASKGDFSGIIQTAQQKVISKVTQTIDTKISGFFSPEDESEPVEPNDPFYRPPEAEHKKKKLLGIIGSDKAAAAVTIGSKLKMGKTTMGASEGMYEKEDNSMDWQWGVHQVGYTPLADPTSAWNLVNATKRNVIVAVIDSGLDLKHQDAPEYIWKNENEIPGNGLDDDGNGYVDDVNGWNFLDNNNDVTDLAGHGSFVTGIIAAKTNNGFGMAGINPGAVIMPIKVANEDGATNSFFIARAIYYAVDNGAEVINLSLGARVRSRLEEMALNYAWQKGVFVAAAAGNVGEDIQEHGPASQRGAFAVGSIDFEGNRSTISNFGANNGLLAPGDRIISMIATGTGKKLTKSVQKAGFYPQSGTSFSTPMVAATASLLLAQNSGLSNLDIEDILHRTATEMYEPGWDEFSGAGLLNAKAALSEDVNHKLTVKVTEININQDDKGNVTTVDVYATVRGDVKSFVVELGKGARASKFEQVSGPYTQQANHNFVAQLSKKEHLKGSREWVLRVVATDSNGVQTIAKTPLLIK